MMVPASQPNTMTRLDVMRLWQLVIMFCKYIFSVASHPLNEEHTSLHSSYSRDRNGPTLEACEVAEHLGSCRDMYTAL